LSFGSLPLRNGTKQPWLFRPLVFTFWPLLYPLWPAVSLYEAYQRVKTAAIRFRRLPKGKNQRVKTAQRFLKNTVFKFSSFLKIKSKFSFWLLRLLVFDPVFRSLRHQRSRSFCPKPPKGGCLPKGKGQRVKTGQ
jgi:hypothetical protein